MRASRSERLADELALALAREQPANPLAPQRVVVAHPGLGRWLRQRWALAPGPDGGRGIAANLVFELPGAWLAGLMAELLDEPGLEAGPFRREPLRWRVHDALGDFRDEAVRRFLDGAEAEAGRRRFQLADRLAGLYTQYLVYRRDWIAAAEDGSERHWQARLWRRLRADIDAAHRGERVGELLARLDAGVAPADPAPLHLFGLDHLPPDTLAVLARLARLRRVVLWFPDPCRHYWHDLVDEARLAKLVAEDKADYRESGHPLVAALATHGQAFNRAITALAAEPELRGEDQQLEDEDPAPRSRLERLQSSIRELDPARLATRDDDPADASLRVHACHTRLRELEVLRDALLDRLAADATLAPRDIVVMAPDIGAYAPLLPAVFGDPDGALPWRVADRSLGALHPLLAAVATLLGLPAMRLTRSEVLALLDVPAIARALGLVPGDREAIERWLGRTRTAWGLDGAMKAAMSGTAEPRFSFAHARDRLMLGWLVGDDDGFDALLERVPAAGADGPRAEALGRLDRLLALLAEGRAMMAGRRSATEWSDWLADWLGRLLCPDPADAGERAAFAAAQALATRLARETGEAGVDPELDWGAVREALDAALAEAPASAPFLGGGINVCGMVPARVIPFRVVALLGLDDGAFPRERSSALDLIAAHPRAGDRDARIEDRYLFLECLMAARETLHLSWCGLSPTDGRACAPAGPLAALMELLEAQAPQPTAAQGAGPPWLVRHALQPFDARYYDGSDPRLFSFQGRFAQAVPDPAATRPAPFVPPVREAAPSRAATLGLDELRAALRDLPAFGLREGLGIDFSGFEDIEDEDSEALDAATDRRDRLPQQLLVAALAEGRAVLPEVAPLALRDTGLLPAGVAGEQAWARLRASVGATLAWLQDTHPALQGQRGATRAVAVTLPHGARLEGTVAGLYVDGGRDLLLRVSGEGGAGPQQLLPLFVDWAALRLARPGGEGPLALLVEPEHGKRKAGAHPAPLAWSTRDADWAALQLATLEALAREALLRPPPLFARAMRAWFEARPGRRLEAARTRFVGSAHQRGEVEWSPAARLLARGRELFDADQPAYREFRALADLLAPLLDPDGEPGE